MLFEHMPMGVAILDRQCRIQRYHPTRGDFAVRYAPLTGAPLAPGVGYFEHLPGSEPIVRPLVGTCRILGVSGRATRPAWPPDVRSWRLLAKLKQRQHLKHPSP
ncbi:MAG: hypothetical protein ACPLXR_08375, partial [Halothiobacillaceae bacterium]